MAKVLNQLSQESGLIFEPVWRKGEATGEEDLNSGFVQFIIDPPKQLLDQSSKMLIGSTFLHGHIAIIKPANSKNSNEKRFGYLNGISQQTLGEFSPSSNALVAMESFSEIHHALMNQQIDAAFLPLRLAQYYLINHGLEGSLVIDRLLTKEPFTYQWLFHPNEIATKQLLEKQIKSWSNQDIAKMMGLPIATYTGPLRWNSWLHILVSICTIAILIMLSWIWHLRRMQRRNKLRESELKQSNHAAIQASKEKTNFLATVSHEIRTPMHAVLGVHELLLQSNSLNNDEKTLLQSAQHSASSLLEMLNQILDLSKIEAGKLFFKNTPTNLSELISQSINPFIRLAQEKGIQCDVQLDRHLAESLLIDAGIIRQIIQNLMSNAIKFTPAGSINISCQVLNDTYAEQLIQITIADTGIGMPPQEINRLLQPYEQLDKNCSNSPGTGLGLAITSRLLQSLSSNLIIESYPSAGTTVSFNLTLARSSAQPIAMIDSSTLAKELTTLKLSHLNALIVDDHAPSLKVLKHQLSQLGIHVYSTNDPLSAIDIASQQRIDLLITDESMPNMNGRELAKQLRGRYPEVVIIGLTADIFAQEKSNIYSDAGMDELLIKPVRISTLESTIRKYFNADIVTQQPIPPKGFNAYKLKEFCGDDSEIQFQILHSILRVQRQSAELLKDAGLNLDVQSIKALAHKIRGGAQLIEANELINTCLRVEKCAESLLSPSLIRQLASAINLSNAEISTFMSQGKHT